METNKQTEVRQFTDQVRVICLKNDIDKQKLGDKIGLNKKEVFSQIKNKSFKPAPEVYVALENTICGKSQADRNKLRSKYERTLDGKEFNKYLDLICGRDVRQTEKKTKEFKVKSEDVVTREEYEKASKKKRNYPTLIDKDSRVKFYELVMSVARPKGVTKVDIDKIIGQKFRMHSVERGMSFVPVEKFKPVMEYLGIKPDSTLYKELLDLELNCIAGRSEAYELAKYEEIFGEKKEKAMSVEEKIEKAEDSEFLTEGLTEAEVKESCLDGYRKAFSEILTKYLFINGYNFKNAANRIGCSEKEFRDVIDAKTCLSPFHVNRFKETLEMDSETVQSLLELSNKAYTRRDIPEKILEYIGSDEYIIDVLEKCVTKNVPASKWKALEEEIH